MKDQEVGTINYPTLLKPLDKNLRNNGISIYVLPKYKLEIYAYVKIDNSIVSLAGLVQ